LHQHPWIAQAHALRMPFFQASRAVHTTRAAQALQGLAGTIRGLEPRDAFAFVVSERALDSHSDNAALLWDAQRAGRWTEAPWVLFAYTDHSAFVARRMERESYRVLPCSWRLKAVDTTPYGFPTGTKLAVQHDPTRPRDAWTLVTPPQGGAPKTTTRLLGGHGLLTNERQALLAALLRDAGRIAGLGKTQPRLNATATGLTGGGALCTPFLTVSLGTPAQHAVRRQALLALAWVLGVRTLHVPMALVGFDRQPMWSNIDARGADDSPMPDAAKRLLDHLRVPYQGVEPWALVEVGDRGRRRIEPKDTLHSGPVPDPGLSAHALLSVLKDTLP
jgi:hypothetical protein